MNSSQFEISTMGLIPGIGGKMYVTVWKNPDGDKFAVSAFAELERPPVPLSSWYDWDNDLNEAVNALIRSAFRVDMKSAYVIGKNKRKIIKNIDFHISLIKSNREN